MLGTKYISLRDGPASTTTITFAAGTVWINIAQTGTQAQEKAITAVDRFFLHTDILP